METGLANEESAAELVDDGRWRGVARRLPLSQAAQRSLLRFEFDEASREVRVRPKTFGEVVALTATEGIGIGVFVVGVFGALIRSTSSPPPAGVIQIAFGVFAAILLLTCGMCLAIRWGSRCSIPFQRVCICVRTDGKMEWCVDQHAPVIGQAIIWSRRVYSIETGWKLESGANHFNVSIGCMGIAHSGTGGEVACEVVAWKYGELGSVFRDPALTRLQNWAEHVGTSAVYVESGLIELPRCESWTDCM